MQEIFSRLNSFESPFRVEKAEQCTTTFLWEGKESYIDVNSFNTCAAPHNRVGALGRGLVPDLKRLTEDHGGLSACLDYWEDELVLQAFNRSLLLSPQIYGNPWLLSDGEFPKLGRIFNLHRKFSGLLVDGIELPPTYGKYAVSIICFRSFYMLVKKQLIF